MKSEYSFMQHTSLPQQFMNARLTVRAGQPIFKDDQYKNIIIESLQFLVSKKRIELNVFIVMHNHIHLIWQAMNDYTPSEIQSSFIKYTAQQIKRSLIKNNPALLAIWFPYTALTISVALWILWIYLSLIEKE